MMRTYRLVSLFWKTCGVFPVGLHEHRISVLFTVVLFVACVIASVTMPAILCTVGAKCETESTRLLKAIYPEAANATSMLSRIALMYSVRLKYRKYKETLQSYEACSPTTAAEAKRHGLFALVTVSTCLVLIVPVNVARLFTLLYYENASGSVIALYLFVYVQNLLMCCSETQFAGHCFAVYCKFEQINREVAGMTQDACGRQPSVVADMNVDAVQALRIRHWLMREAVGCLNGMFGVQLGMSVCVLCVMIFFDIYYEAYHVMGHFGLSDLIACLWMVQYALRYLGIILMSHFTTKQVYFT